MSALIQFDRIGKTYANGSRALDDVSFTLHRGAIHAICGENGAGKSTLMKILFGLEQPSTGTLRLRGAELTLDSPRTAAALGIGMVHQHFSLIAALTVAENLALGQEPTTLGGLRLDRAAAAERVRELAQRYQLAVEPDALVASLSLAMRQKVEILKALSHEIELLILDEPTAVLTPQETAELFAQLRVLRQHGLTIVFISHKLREVRALADRVIVLRAGRVSSDTALADVSDADIARLAMGAAAPERPAAARAAAALASATTAAAALASATIAAAATTSASASATTAAAATPGAALVTLERLCCGHGAGRIDALSLTLHAGEIVGVAGVDGSGQAALVAALMGRWPLRAGRVLLGQRDISALGAGARRRLGFGHLPADRLRDGSAPALSLVDNAMAGAHRLLRFCRGPWLRRAAWEAASAAMLDAYDVRRLSLHQPLSSLSGGNAQKLIAARELGARPQVLVAEEPTRGIDARAAALLHAGLAGRAADGGAVLLLSSDLDELLALSDRIIVLHGGRIVATFDRDPLLTPARLGAAMLGLAA
ncbi:ABC transporter ATP-binding protein [Rugamonas sp.]|uniref:ABC transporter ATP-binding protein n=1 Tax=Rugamonas sp. TaxID=1926287 RepID=UPI0025D2220B|nr:ATP-binding cassette domain-containing protein [Rugamonas sp.]